MSSSEDESSGADLWRDHSDVLEDWERSDNEVFRAIARAARDRERGSS